MLYQVLLVAYLIVAIMLIGFVLIQQGKGADMGASFGAGGTNTIFGSSGSGNFMTKTTAILATAFFAISLIIGGITSSNNKAVDEFENIQAPVAEVEQTLGLEEAENDTGFPVLVEDAEAAVQEATEDAPAPPATEDKP